MEAVTERQERVLRVLVGFIEDHDRPPTTRELARALGCHVKTVYQYILALERKGCVTRENGHLRVAAELRRGLGIPVVGRVAAGTPILAVQNREGVLALGDLFGRDDVFAVRVAGDSMRDAGILDGDMVIVRTEADVPQGAIAVCYVGEEQEATVKRLRRRNGGFELVPENEAYRPIRVARDDPHFRLGGRVVGVVRRVSK